MSKLTLRYRYDSSFFDPKKPRDDFGWLAMDVQADRSSINGGFWVQWQDVREFGEALNAVPVSAERPIVAQWGFGMQEGDDLRLRIEITPAQHGDLSVQFEVADYEKPHHRLRGCFSASYSEVDAFRTGIARLMDGEADQATLTGS
jgi:hypothetical protein